MTSEVTKPNLKLVDFAGLTKEEIKQALIARIKECTKQWNIFTVDYFEQYATNVELYVNYGFDIKDLEIGENEYEMLRLISEGKFSAKGIPLIIKNVRVARELKLLSLEQQERLFVRGTIDIVRNHNPITVSLADVKPSEVRNAISAETGVIRLLSSREQLNIIDARPANPHKIIAEFGDDEYLILVNKAKDAGLSNSNYIRKLTLEALKKQTIN